MIGVHYGPHFFGNIGDELSKEFIVIGGAVKLASTKSDAFEKVNTNLIISKIIADNINLHVRVAQIKDHKIRVAK